MAGKKKEKEYELYKLWKSLPPVILGTSEQELIKKFGIDDPLHIELVQIKTQGEFAKKYGVSIDTTSDWNARMKKEGNDYMDMSRQWAMQLNKNVVMAHYNKIIRKFDPVSAELWYKIIDGWNEKKQIEHSGKMTLYDLAKMSDDEDELKK